MLSVRIDPRWSVTDGTQEVLSPRLLALLVAISDRGSLAAACEDPDTSYRYAWGLLRDAQTRFGMPLVESERGQGSRLTPLGQRLVWADQRIAARLAPILATLSSELESEIERIRSANTALLHLHASHGFAVETLRDLIAHEALPIEFKYRASQEAVASLANHSCEIAGFPVPTGRFQQAAIDRYASALGQADIRLIPVAVRQQGLIVARGNPKGITGLPDLVRDDIHFINRERGSGTRLLLELLLGEASIKPARINGFEDVEYTHAAIAAYIASGRADAGIGVETPARTFALDFIPLETERYFFACHLSAFELPQIQGLLRVLRSATYHRAVDALPGYQSISSGEILTLKEAFGAPVAHAGRPRARAAGSSGPTGG